MREALGVAGTRELDRAPDAGSSVPCPLKGGQQIAPGRCVEWQRDNGCHCQYALVSLRRVEKLLEEEPPAPSASERANLQRKGIYFADREVEHAERRDEVRSLMVRAEQIEKQRPAKPAEEDEMAEKKECPLCGKTLRADNSRGWCTSHLSGTGKLNVTAYLDAQKKGIEVPSELQPRIRGENAGPAESKPHAAAPKKPRVVKPRAPRASPPSAPAIPEDIVGLLQRQRDHYQAQVARIERALAALRD